MRRLSQIYLPEGLAHRAPPWLTQLLVGLAASGVAFLLRALLELAVPGVIPFALLFPATVVATLLAGWQAGAWAILIGGLSTWYFIFPFTFSLALPRASDLVSLALFVVASSAITLFADAYRRSARKLEAERELQLLLINELNHRVKNTLATVQSVSAQTLGHSAVDRAAKDAFEARLMALSRAHDVLTTNAWARAGLAEIVAQAVAPFEAGRVSIRGPDVSLAPSQALALSMALHELGANACRHGALSGPAGEVQIRWTANDGVLHLIWEERGGPPVSAPSRRGFGSRLLERALPRELQGEVRLSFTPSGLTCEISAPLANPAAARPMAVPPTTGQAARVA